MTKTSVPLIQFKPFRNSSTTLMNSENGFQPLNPYEFKPKTTIATVFTIHVICGFKIHGSSEILSRVPENACVFGKRSRNGAGVGFWRIAKTEAKQRLRRRAVRQNGQSNADVLAKVCL